VRRFVLAVCLALSAAAGCKGPGPRAAPSHTLEKAVFFSERDERGHAHAISAQPAADAEALAEGLPASADPAAPGTPPAEEPVASVADGATLDVNSKLRIDLRLGEIDGGLDDGALADLEAQAQALTSALEQIAGYIEAEARAAEAWLRYQSLDESQQDGSAEERDFIEARRARAQAELSFLEPIRALWPRDDAALADERARAEVLVDRLEGGEEPAAVVEEMNALLQERVQAWSRAAERLEEDSTEELESRRLRIEAFVIPSDPQAKPQAVHVPGYDDLDVGEVQRIDPYGLALSEDERARLVELMSASKELAAALERIRTGQQSWQEAFLETRSALGQRFAELAQLASELEGDALRTRADATRSALMAFVEAARPILPQLVEERAPIWRERLNTALDASSELAALAELAADLSELARRWRSVEPPEMEALLVDSANAASRIEEALSSETLSTALQSFTEQLEVFLAEELGALSEEAQQQLRSAAQPLLTDLAGWKRLAQEVRSALEALARFLGLGGSPPVDLDLASPASFSVPLDSAPDTSIDLLTARRRPGDRLRVRARLLAGDGADAEDAAEPLEATFDLEQLGWHANYVPAVVYVTADRVAGADDSGGFSASLSWQWSYGARDDEDDPYLSRMLGWSAGLHAALLAFAPDNDPEVGLGVSLGLWQNRILLGAGYNLFADSDEDGRYYYTIGSSLIPLLQALQSDAD
jgi:hypothetical protein